MKFDNVFWFLKKGRELSEKEKRWEGERFIDLFVYIEDIEKEKYKIISRLQDDFKELLRMAEKNFERLVREKWDGNFSSSPFFIENTHQGQVNSYLSSYTVRYSVDKLNGKTQLRVSIRTDQRHDSLVCAVFNDMTVNFLDPEYNERGAYYTNADKIELVVNFFRPIRGVVNLDAL